MRRGTVLTVTLNPCLDRTLSVESLVPGTTHRVLSVRTDAGGKGVNVSRLAHDAGLETHALAIAGGDAGNRLSEALDTLCIPHTFFPGEGETRVNLKIADADGGMTEFNASGAPAGNAFPQLIQALETMLPQAAILVLAGSVPPDLPTDVYAQITMIAKRYDVPVILDASGAYLRDGAKETPFAVKPNRAEFESWIGRKLQTKEDLFASMRLVQSQGISFVTVSLGDEGALFLNDDTMMFSPPLHVHAVCPAAAGDAMVAMLCYGYVNALPFEKTAQLMTAAGSLTAAMPGTQMTSFADISAAAGRVQITRIER